MAVEIIEFKSELRQHFRLLNEEWLNEYYFVTESDTEILSNPEKIIEDGGFIFFAIEDSIVLGTCALLKHDHSSFELIKMGVKKNSQNKGVGSLLMRACVETAIKNKAEKLSLETAIPLKAAIHLYRKFGFIQTSEEYTHPVFKRTTFTMELIL